MRFRLVTRNALKIRNFVLNDVDSIAAFSVDVEFALQVDVENKIKFAPLTESIIN